MPASTLPLRTALPLILVLTFVWGTNWVLFPLAVKELSVWSFRAFSTLGSGLALLAWAKVRGESLAIPRGHRGTVVAAAMAYLVVWNIASTYAAVLIPSGQAAVLGFTMPLWAALFGALFLRQKLERRSLAALALGLLGVGLLAVRGLHAYAQAPLGFAAGIAAAVGWAVGTLILKRRPPPVAPLVLTGWQMLITSVPITLGALWLGDGWFWPSWQSVAVVAYITLVPMALGNVAWFSIVGLLPAHVAGLGSVLVPVVAMLTGALVRGEPLGPVELLAMACSVGAVALALGLRTPAPRLAR
ncbi:DMT family transporter [Ramlibacter sp. G-1-2-2]|uniref:DMT family transporter n=1 Tax=Ramlibacter agri TaxID=2728837 RepID=A0A848GZK1_9BURK|nr:DMT family transporter [Ramlibacter agri]NML44126.1 DMT family transporter [Ramlibacter agri]